MRLDANIETGDLSAMGTIAARAEELGFAGIWTTETQHDPFLPLVPAALGTTKLELGTAIAVAFPRSPTVTAHTAWDLARVSGGRFILGLGTQVKAHIERRYSVAWDSPVDRLRDYIGAMRAVWHCWQTGERLRYEGEFYTLKLMTPFFAPEPLPEGISEPPVYIAGVNKNLCRLAGEICQGFHAHPFNSARYLRESVLPWISEGLGRAGRERGDIQVTCSIFAITGQNAEEREKVRREVRQQIAFYASTPSYRTVLAAHGWEEHGEELSRLAGRGRWQEMGDVMTDEMLAEFSLEGESLVDVALEANKRYTGLLDRVALYLPFKPGERDEEWSEAARVFARAE